MVVDQEKTYIEFLKRKIKVAESYGFEVPESDLNPILKPHQKKIVQWLLHRGRGAAFSNFGLGKTIMQLETANQVVKRTGKPALLALPLAVRFEFMKDAKKLGLKVAYCRDQEEADHQIESGVMLIMSNYDRIRTGVFEPEKFGCVCLDEASVIRSMGTQTTQYILSQLKNISFRFVFTATPSPNEYHELLKYSEFLGIMSISHALSRWFKRNSTKAHESTLLEHREADFWVWMSSWANFLTKPSDLGFDDTGYDYPKMSVIWHRVTVDRENIVDANGNPLMFEKQAQGLSESNKEKKLSMNARIYRAVSWIKKNPGNWLIWHHREDERKLIQKELGDDCKSVWGSQNEEEKEEFLIGFSEGKYKYLSTKPEIAGSGCNFQYHCHKAFFCGIDYRFNDFLQAIHRIYRFGQEHKVEIHILYTDAEDHIRKTFEAKWNRHDVLVSKMQELIREHGLSTNIRSDVQREFFFKNKSYRDDHAILINGDSCFELDSLESNSIDFSCSSIPFSDLFEYAESYNDMGQCLGDTEFFEHLSYLTPNWLRVTKPGRLAAIHVKDIMKYSWQNNLSFPTLHRFSDKVADHFESHGWHTIGRITICTDVVQENSQTYRLGWSEKCKDGTKMSVGLPEYVWLFRKAPTSLENGYADQPVTKLKEYYTRARWQIDAHSHWKSNGNRLLTDAELKKMPLGEIMKWWKNFDLLNAYCYERHIDLNQKLESFGKLPSSFMVLPVRSQNSFIWDDIQRINTLNSKQARARLIKHVCPLQLDLIERLIELFTEPDETVLDPFGGIMSTPYVAVENGRKAIAIELNENSWKDGVRHMRLQKMKAGELTLFSAANGF
ncbi:hypothetical protein LAG90_15780 [Marinilongibacter aquaticus]|uniref:DNA methyltransferase n=1 Tax=Marinilongibacter aquaticus TaxID=2975157 RepID=UPI0021BDE1F5|nr:DNA methyltransferase [Marinilongibacter aquaticus]UBM58264.1 hypothetical protein LAG90_15780 [Marinilongibacter aquaticus]